MPWKIIRSHYDPLDPSTLHDDEMIAIESALRRAAQRPSNETNPSWRAWRKVRPLRRRLSRPWRDCDGARAEDQVIECRPATIVIAQACLPVREASQP